MTAVAPRLAAAFAAPRARRAALIPYLTGGHPDLATSHRLIDTLIDSGADIVELGVPFSDPMADGPVVQRSTHEALAAGITPDDVLELAAARRHAVPFVLLAYANTVLAGGPARLPRPRRRVRRRSPRRPRPPRRRSRWPHGDGAGLWHRPGAARRADEHRCETQTRSPRWRPASSTASRSRASRGRGSRFLRRPAAPHRAPARPHGRAPRRRFRGVDAGAGGPRRGPRRRRHHGQRPHRPRVAQRRRRRSLCRPRRPAASQRDGHRRRLRGRESRERESRGWWATLEFKPTTSSLSSWRSPN